MKETYTPLLNLNQPYLFSFEADKSKTEKPGKVQLPEKYRGGSPEIRDLRIYEDAMKGGAMNG